METVKKTILIVEDEASQMKALAEQFIREGFAVLQEKNGKDGLKTALKDHPDIILLDILMPKMDGMAVLKKLRQENAWGKSVPVIVLTNLSPDEEWINQSITENEPAYYLLKSDETLSDLVEKVKEVLA